MSQSGAYKSSRTMALLLAGLSGLWLAAWCFPSLAGAETQFVPGFFVGLLTLSIFRWVTRYTTGAEQGLWAALTIAWALGILGNVVWGISSLTSEMEPSLFSWIDGLYVARYAVIFLGLWFFSRPWRWTRWAAVVVIATAATALLWSVFFRPVMHEVENPVLFFASGALYPVLDPVLLFGALCAWLAMTDARGRRAAALLIATFLCYGAANWINFVVRGTDWNVTTPWATLGWGISDILAAIAGLSVIWRAKK